MSYATSMLVLGERIGFRARVSPFAYISALLWLVGGMWPLPLLRLMRTELVLTDRRIIGQAGGLHPTPCAWKYSDVERVKLQRSLLGLMFGYGTIIAVHAHGREVKFPGIGQPVLVQAEAEDAIEIAVLGYRLRDFGKGPADPVPVSTQRTAVPNSQTTTQAPAAKPTPVDDSIMRF